MVTSRFGYRSKRAASVLVFGLVALAAGCTEIFGFQRPGDIVSCVRDSDCPGSLVCLSNTCTFACARGEDCHALGYPPGTAACVANQCVPIEPAEAGPGDATAIEAAADDAGDVQTSETADAPADAAETGAVAESSTPDAGPVCTPSCATFSYCKEGSCLDFQAHGYPGPGPDEQDISGDKLVTIKIFPNVCGYLTGIGFVTANHVLGQRIRLGLYTDNSGLPDQLIAQTAPATVALGANELAAETMPLVGCADVAPHYWIAGVWDDGVASLATDQYLSFQAETNSNAIGFFANLDRATDDVIDAGLPAIFPTPARPLATSTAMPHVYVIVARAN